MTDPAHRLRQLATSDLTPAEVQAILAILEAAFDEDDPDERFTEDDWRHALGGVHVVLEVGGVIVSHAALVERELHASGRPLRTGYVEAVATVPWSQERGYGTEVMRAVGGLIEDRYELGALGTGRHGFYERLGWRVWRGPTSVRTADGEIRTPEDDGFVLVLPTPTTPPLDEDGPLSCDWRPGDVW
jgi:aminoglycoside 2'-N-acetyltransferase I